MTGRPYCRRQHPDRLAYSLLPDRDEWRPELQGLAVDQPRATVTGPPNDGASLSPQQQVVLGCLLVRPDASISALQSALWGRWGEAPDRSIDVIRVIILNLRHKLGKRCRIVTLNGYGYRLEAAPNDNQPPSEAAA